ncbi:putative F-box protein At4g38870 [Solanum pennellii]|uniref:F-box protein At4g38870 n=1 Tax=Solanum pennellii TaxID=28526 RepID=A0ABM1V290_SOLPN|nr:putative F-box protein At4g38870 [Solanum pennellii]
MSFYWDKIHLKGEEVYYTAEEKEDGKESASLLQVDKFNNIYNRIPTNSHFSSCVNGLFCYWRSSSILIFNPSTKELRFLPHLKKHILWCNYSLGFEPKENKYKVVSAEYHAQEGYIKYWIFTLGIDKSWRETQSVLSCFPSTSPSVCISGVIYQFIYESVINGYKSAIVAFDVKSENYEIIALSEAFRMHCHELIEVMGKLATIDYDYESRQSGYLDMWILD